MTESLLDGSILAEQIQLEEEAIARGAARYRRLAAEAVSREDGASLKPAERMVVHWMEPLVMAVDLERAACLDGKPAPGRGMYAPILCALDTDRLAFLVIHTTMSRCMAEPNGDLLPRVAYAIGAAVIAEIHMDLLKQDSNATLKDLDRKFKRLNTQRINWWAKRSLTNHIWNRKVAVHLGSSLLNCLVKSASFKPYTEEFSPAFVHEKQWRDNQKKGVIRMVPEVFDLLEDGHVFRQGLRPRYMPMLVEPYPWSNEHAGGYVRVRTPLLNKPTPEQSEEIEKSDMTAYFDGLNAISGQAWSVNNLVYLVMKNLWEAGGGGPGMPAASDRPMPPKSPAIEADPALLKKWKRQAHEVHTANAKARGARAEFIQRLTLAGQLRHSRFHLPHSACFRSRVYPIPLYLNPQSNDCARGLLLFADGKPLTPRGKWWLRVEAANTWGLDKVPLTQRVEWADQEREMIDSVARNPLSDTRWHQAEDPWQFLATAMAIVYPEVGERYPCKIDGSLNGLQHLAAAANCEIAGSRVNLLPSTPDDWPADAYQDVANVARKRNTDPSYTDLLEQHGRLLAKQPTMTKVYGCTRVGARDQVRDKLKKLEIPRDKLFTMSRDLSGLVLESIGEVCGRANDLFTWFEEAGRALCKHDPMKGIRWVTPLGFPVIQPYRRWGKCTIRTAMQRITLAYRMDEVEVHLARQVQGITANWTHSQDASHCLMTGAESRRRGLAFGCVHDSFWSLAEDIDELNEISRDQFVKLYAGDPIAELAAYWREHWPGVDLPDPPARGQLEINGVQASTYFFS